MGLAEKRAVGQFKDNQFPVLLKEIQTIVGYPLTLDVKWDTMAAPNRADSYADYFPKVFFTPLTDALKAIAIDDMGREALKNSLKKVVIDGTSGSNSYNFTFEDGTLNLLHEVDVNVDDVADRTRGIQKLLESKL